ncbi:MAG: hypothetical protein L0027_06135, partial [Candidatus Rokubacteria bacterium]|nr:hypothetical protein [Candidatus Rokubacteria bacterium]
MTQKRLRLPVVVAAVLLTAATAAGWPPGATPAWWIAVPLGACAFLALGAVEPALVAALSAAAGALWAARLHATLGIVPPAGGASAAWTVGSAVALPLVRGRLARFRGEEGKVWDRCVGVALAVCTGLALWSAATRSSWTLFVVLPPLSVLVLARAGMDVLLFMDNRRGAPRLVWLLGSAFALAYIVVAQILLLLVAAPLRFLPGDPKARLRRLGRLGPRSLFGLFPYGRLETFGIEPAAFERPAIVVSNHQS